MDETVIDIREQFALSRADTIRIASTLGFKHPKGFVEQIGRRPS